MVVHDRLGCAIPRNVIDRLADQSAVSMFVIGVITIEVWHTEFPVWAFVLSLLIGD